MTLTHNQLQAANQGEAVKVEHNGETYYLLSSSLYDELDVVDCSPLTSDEIDLLADVAADIAARGEPVPHF